jgi:hypothetical protein
MERSKGWSALTVLVAAASAIAVLGIGRAHATNQGITGKKLLIKSGKFVLLSSDPSISIAGSNAVGGADSTITFDAGGGPVSLALPKTLWAANGAGTLFKYKNAAAPGGPSVVKGVKIAGGTLKAGGKGAPIAVPNGAASINVVLSLDGGTNTYCMTFSGTGDGNKFLVKDASAGTCPGSGAVCGNNVREGSEQCDGTDATACPGNCLANCTCPAQTCGNNVREGTEQCDGTDATACPGNCQANCTCPAQTCGNNVREGTEQCDGTDDTACPGNCNPGSCTCTCPTTGGDATACAAFSDSAGACRACMNANPAGIIPCLVASGAGELCLNPMLNDGCSTEVNTYSCGAQCCSVPGCGNNIKEGTEQCDGSSAVACPGQCKADCTCPVCGDNVREGTEQCDGTDAAACPGQCVNCKCAEICGNNVREGNEQCDGSDAALCPGTCQANCVCPSTALCGNGVREGNEKCDGMDSVECPGECQADCTCPVTSGPCGSGAEPECGGSCPAAQFCVLTNVPSSPVCGCVDSCRSGASCVTNNHAPPCPPGYVWTDLGALGSFCLGPSCSSNCLCPAPGFCVTG